MKLKKSYRLFILVFAFLLTLCQATNVSAQTDTPEPKTPDSTMSESENTEEQVSDEDQPLVKSAPDTLAIRLADLKAQYPQEEQISLKTNGESFTALWKKDQSGEALGAVLIVPAEGQTANWPNTIDVLRNELPKDGWSTLSIDIEHAEAQNRDQTESTLDDANLDRIQSAIAFLHEQGQYNIVLAGYGFSAFRILSYASRSDALGMNRTIKSTQSTNLKRPVRALILISPLSYSGDRLSSKLGKFPYKDMPIMDIVFGSHYLDTFDSKERLSNARSLRFKHYIQIKSVEPTISGKMFGKENRLSRRVRGFLDSYAKGVEIERR